MKRAKLGTPYFRIKKNLHLQASTQLLPTLNWSS